ncbi:MAG: hypothetical protein KBS56_05605 [Clostridiales bacterium]|nr:hypothetical protein [Candidatus Crickella equi]
MAKNSNKTVNKKNPIRTVIAVLLLVFAVSVLFNFFRPNMAAKADKTAMKANVKTISEMQTADVATIEKKVRDLDARDARSNSEGMRVIYRKMFSTSVILGDSLTEGLDVYGWLPNSVVFSKVGGSIVYGDDVFAKAAKTKPEYAFFAYGMNDMGNYSGNDKNFIAKYTSLLEKFKKTSPKTMIIVNSITTPTKAARAGNKSIRNYKKFNKAIKKMCKKQHYIYLDITDILPDNPDLYAGDGIHAAPAYYPLWMDRMIDAAGLTMKSK